MQTKLLIFIGMFNIICLLIDNGCLFDQNGFA